MRLPSVIPPGVRAIYFDAVGTVIHPRPSAGAVYADIGRRFGSQLDAGEVKRRFAVAFQAEEDADARHDHRTDEARELERWWRIVDQVLDDVRDREACFAALYVHFAEPSAWAVDPAAASVLDALRRDGYQIGLATNFDHRLRSVLAGLPALAALDDVVISSEVGWKKPAAGFFAELTGRRTLVPNQVLLVGDDLENDYTGATAAGLHARLLDPTGACPVPPEHRLAALTDLVAPGVR